MTADEQYIYDERLALLGVIGRPATDLEEQLARADVERFNAELWQNEPEPPQTYEKKR